MRWPKPSLVRRLTLGFVLAYFAAAFLLILFIWPVLASLSAEHQGPEVAISYLRDDLVDARGKLTLREADDWRGLAKRNPKLWFVARGEGRRLDFGPVPASAGKSLEALEGALTMGEFRYAAPRGPLEDWSIEEVETSAGSLHVAAGGVDPATLTMSDYVAYFYKSELYMAAILLALLAGIGGGAAIPIVLRSLRPTANAAAELDPSDLDKRLPEKRVVKELLPIVRAFNAALDRLAQAFERRRRFIADVAHELRTPLAVLNMHVEALPDAAGKPDLQRGVYRLGQMVGQMLDAERLALAARRREPVDLVALSRAAVADVAPLAVANGYEIGLTADEDSVVIDGDPYAVSRAIANLLGNAIAHGGQAGTIEVRVRRERVVEVADQGPGVPVEARERIFEPFHRERWDRDGCGLGLHLVHEIMEAHGGRASLSSSGSGAVFALNFPPQNGVARHPG